VAVFNLDDRKGAAFTLKTTGLADGDYTVIREDGVKPLGDKTISADELATGIGLSVPVSATRVFEIRKAK